MKLNRRQLRRLIENTLVENYEDTSFPIPKESPASRFPSDVTRDQINKLDAIRPKSKDMENMADSLADTFGYEGESFSGDMKKYSFDIVRKQLEEFIEPVLVNGGQKVINDLYNNIIKKRTPKISKMDAIVNGTQIAFQSGRIFKAGYKSDRPESFIITIPHIEGTEPNNSFHIDILSDNPNMYSILTKALDESSAYQNFRNSIDRNFGIDEGTISMLEYKVFATPIADYVFNGLKRKIEESGNRDMIDGFKFDANYILR